MAETVDLVGPTDSSKGRRGTIGDGKRPDIQHYHISDTSLLTPIDLRERWPEPTPPQTFEDD